MFDMFHAWQQQSAKLENREISRDEYDEWRYTYPALDASGHYAKVPSQELSDLLIKELDKESKKNRHQKNLTDIQLPRHSSDGNASISA